MFLDAKLSKLQVRSAKDKPISDFGDSRMELYQTWQLSEMSGLGAESFAGKQGFSAIEARDMRLGAGDVREQIDDPRISHLIPENGVIQLDIHYWESDDGDSTRAVKSTFTNAALEKLMEALKAASKDERAAKESFDNWIGENAPKLIEAGIGVAVPTVSPVLAAIDLKPLLSSLVSIAKNNGDDYHGSSRFIIQTRADGTWRIIGRDRPTRWLEEEGPISILDTIQVANGKIDYDAVFEIAAYKS